MSLIDSYNGLIEKKIIEKAEHQSDAIISISSFCNEMVKNRVGFFNNLFKKNKGSTAGIYIYGSVGSGKTKIATIATEYIKQELNFRTISIHCSRLFNLMHNTNNLEIYDKIKKYEYDLMFIDEFDVSDIVFSKKIKDYILLGIEQKKIFIFTSNQSPEILYKDGLQRDSFLELINTIYSRFKIIKMDCLVDYREKIRNAKIGKNIYINQNSQDSFLTIHSVFLDHLNSSEANISNIKKGCIDVNGRKLEIDLVADKNAYFDFNNIFDKPTGNDDYVKICNIFETVFISSIPAPTNNNLDSYRRFIKFVDMAYEHKKKIIYGLIFDLDKMFDIVKNIPEIKRTVSRIKEMDTW